jgi:hypothetical protein
MRKGSLVKMLMAGLVIVMISACSKLPQVEIDAAYAAIDETAATGAEVYNRDNYLALQDSMKAVMEKIELEKSKFFKKFNPLKENLGQIVVMANEVTMQTVAKKAELRQEIESSIADIKNLLTENRQLVTEAPKGKEGTTVLLAIKSELDAIEESLTEVNTLLNEEDYMASLSKAKSAQQKAVSINEELKEVIAKYKGKGKKN